MPVRLTDEMKELLDKALIERSPCLVATSSADGVPDISYRGSVLMLDDEHLAFWERVKGETLSNLYENPKICIFYRNGEKRISWRFYGEAQVLTEGPVREQVMERVNQFELMQDPERKGFAIVIRVDRVRSRDDVIMEREPAS